MTLAGLDPDARGVPLRIWRLQDIARQAAEHAATLSGTEAPIQRKPIATPRDNYGWRAGHDNRAWHERHK